MRNVFSPELIAFRRRFQPFGAVVGPTLADGDFNNVQDAVDAGCKSIFVRDGEYPHVSTSVSGLTIIGESRQDTIFRDDGHSGAILQMNGEMQHLENFKVVGDPGGGNNDNAAVLFLQPYGTAHFLWVYSSDGYGIQMNSNYCHARFCRVGGGTIDSAGIVLVGTDSSAVGNDVKACTGGGILVFAGSTHWIVQSNHVADSITIQGSAEDGAGIGNVHDGALNDTSGTSLTATATDGDPLNEQY